MNEPILLQIGVNCPRG